MIVQKFNIGDTVRIRPFDLIDETDIGGLSHSENTCYGISRHDVEKGAAFGDLVVQRATMCKGAYVYCLSREGQTIAYQWAQGMIEPACVEPIEIPDADEFLANMFA